MEIEHSPDTKEAQSSASSAQQASVSSSSSIPKSTLPPRALNVLEGKDKGRFSYGGLTLCKM